jgi:DNA sulfur modification protein DndB
MPSITIPATKIKQSSRSGYLCTLTFGALVKFFQIVTEKISLEDRHQRTLSQKRAEEIGDYLVEATKKGQTYVLPPLVASIEGETVAFEEIKDGVGVISVDLDTATFLLNDGQHRRKGIELALEEYPSLKDDEIGVFLLTETSLEDAQQIFADINRNVKAPSKSLALTFDRNSDEAKLLREVKAEVSIFRYLELEKSQPGNDSIFVLQTLAMAIKMMQDGFYQKDTISGSEAQKKTIIAFWKACQKYIPEWKRVDESLPSEVTLIVKEVRKISVAFGAATLIALGILAAMYIKERPYIQLSWDKILAKLSSFDFQKTNPLFLNVITLQSATNGSYSLINSYEARFRLARIFKEYLDS